MNYLHSPFVVNVGENIHNHLIVSPSWMIKYQGDILLSSHHQIFIYLYFIQAFLIKTDSYFLSLFKLEIKPCGLKF